MKKLFLLISLLISTTCYSQIEFNEVFENLLMYFNFQDGYKDYSESWIDNDIEECNPNTMLGSGSYGWRKYNASWDSNTVNQQSGTHCIEVRKTGNSGGAWSHNSYWGWSKRTGSQVDSLQLSVYVFNPDASNIDTIFFGFGNTYIRGNATIYDEDTITTKGSWIKSTISWYTGFGSYIWLTAPDGENDTFYIDNFKIRSRIFLDNSIYSNYLVPQYKMDNDTIGHKSGVSALKINRGQNQTGKMFFEDCEHLNFSKVSTDSSDKPFSIVFFGSWEDQGFNWAIMEKESSPKEWEWFKETNDFVYFRVFDENGYKREHRAPNTITTDHMADGDIHCLIVCYDGKNNVKWYLDGDPWTTSLYKNFQADYKGMSPHTDKLEYFTGQHNFQGICEALMIYSEYISDAKASKIYNYLNK